MTKLLVTAAHPHGPLKNGEGGCHARWADDGMCPGVERAAWLNSLGEDDKPYGSGSTGLTNLDVRLNWLRGNHHIVAMDATLEGLLRQRQDAKEKLRVTTKRIREITRVNLGATPQVAPRTPRKASQRPRP